MKDRTKRNGYRKVNRKLKNFAIVFFALTAVIGSFSAVYLSKLNQENTVLSESIHNYTTQIDMLESEDDSRLRHR